MMNMNQHELASRHTQSGAYCSQAPFAVNPWEILDTLPDYLAVIDTAGMIRYLNANWYQLIRDRAVGNVGFHIGNDFLISFAAAFGEDHTIVQAMDAGISAVLHGNEEQCRLSYPYTRHDGVQSLFTTTITPTYMPDGSRGLLIRQVDCYDTRASHSKPLRRGMLFDILGAASEQFLRTGAFDEPLEQLLEQLGHATGTSRVYLVENVNHYREELCAYRRFEWVADGVVPQMHNPEFQGLPYAAERSRWQRALSQGEPIVGVVSNVPDEEQGILAAQGIRSFAVFPVFVAEQWWGYLGFDDCVGERLWHPDDIHALARAAGIIGAAIQHHHTRGGGEKALAMGESSGYCVLP